MNPKEKQIGLMCEDCEIEYQKPEHFKERVSNVFFRWSLKYCDPCRRKRELEALRELPNILNALSK